MLGRVSSRSAAIQRGVVVQVGARVAGLMLSLITVKTSTTYLGPEQYGILTAAVVIVGVFEAFTELGIGSVIVRRVSQGRGELVPLAGTNLGLSVLLGPTVAVAAVLVGFLFSADDPQQRLAVGIIAIGLVFSTLASCAGPVFQTRIRFGGSAVADISSRGLALGGTLLVAALDLGVIAMAAVQVIHPFVRMVVNLYAAQRMEPFRIRFDPSGSWSLIRESLPLTAMLIVGFLYWRADGLIVEALSTSEQVAAYGVALAIAGNLNVIPQVLAKTALSTLTDRRHSDPPAFVRTVQRIYQLMLLCALPIAVFGYILAEQLVPLISDERFVPLTTPVLQLFFIGMAIGFLNPVLSTSLFAAGQQKFLLGMAFVTLGVNIAVGFALVPSLGAAGAGYALIASELVGVSASTYMLWRVGVPPVAALDVGRILPAVTLGLAVLYLVRDLPVLISGPILVLVYGAAVVVTGAFQNTIMAKLVDRLAPAGKRLKAPA